MNVEVKVGNGFKYLDKIINLGEEYRFKKFAKLENRKKDKLILETLAIQYADICSKAKNCGKFEFTADGTEIIVSREVNFEIKGVNKEGITSSEKSSILMKLLHLVPFSVKGNSVFYYMKFEVFDDKVLMSRIKKENYEAFKKYQIKVSEHEKRILNDSSQISFWEKALPNNYRYGKNDPKILSDFTDVLKKHNLTQTSGDKVLCMKKIYNAAIKTYPIFKKMPISDQIKILDTALNKAYNAKKSYRDIGLLAKSTWMELNKENIDRVIVFGDNNEKCYKVCEYEETSGNSNWKGMPRMILYNYKTKNGYEVKTCLLPFDLWHELVKN